MSSGDTLRLDFEVAHQAKGFTNQGADVVVAEKFVSLKNYEWLPVIGYQRYRELDEPALRKKNGLHSRPITASLYDTTMRNYAPFAEHINFNATVSTDIGHIAVAPGTLRKRWNKGNRTYFQYRSDFPIRNEYAFYSANYAVYEAQWRPVQNSGKAVSIQIYHDPSNSANVERMVKSIKASLSYYSDQFGPYPHHQLRFVATPGYSGGNHAAPINITTEEGFFLMNTMKDSRGFDFVTAVVAHEVAHQWWGNRLKSADVQGAGLLSESLAWYSAMGVLEEKYGSEHREKLLAFLREEYENPRTRAALPLLQAGDFYHYYRKGPFALHALSRYIGKQQVNTALRRLLEKHPPGKMPMATALDLYSELQTVTPDSVRNLVDDLFKRNTFWDLKVNQASAKKNKNGTWQLTFQWDARKQVVSEEGLEKQIPIKDWIEIGVFGDHKKAEGGKLLYLQKHFVDLNSKTITLNLPFMPSSVGFDPNHLLIDWNIIDNFAEVKIQR